MKSRKCKDFYDFNPQVIWLPLDYEANCYGFGATDIVQPVVYTEAVYTESIYTEAEIHAANLGKTYPDISKSHDSISQEWKY